MPNSEGLGLEAFPGHGRRIVAQEGIVGRRGADDVLERLERKYQTITDAASTE